MFNIIAISFWGIMEMLGYAIGIFAYFCGGFLLVKRTYDINMKEIELLSRYYNAWGWSPYLEYQLQNLNPYHTATYLKKTYDKSTSEENFIWRCNSLRPSGGNVLVFRY